MDVGDKLGLSKHLELSEKVRSFSMNCLLEEAIREKLINY